LLGIQIDLSRNYLNNIGSGRMLKKSASMFIIGFASGVIVSSLLILTFPWIYYAFLELLARKVEVQCNIISEPKIMIPTNNILAALVCTFGGYCVSKIYLFLNTKKTSKLAKKISLLDKQARNIPEEYLKYHLVLYIFPVFILFLNGFVLGAFFVLYIEAIDLYFTRLLPHGFFEFPAIIISGALGLEIARESCTSLVNLEEFKKRIDGIAKNKAWKFMFVIALLIIGGVLEAA
jgi:uncharacterized membrane protein SpoIIM required for sporulation